MKTYVALLRGINVGGNNKVPMKELVAMFAALGHGRAQTYLQSGNVVFEAAAPASKLAPALESSLEETFHLKISVILRTPAELEALAGQNPYLSKCTDFARLHVLFLADVPTAENLAALEPDRFAPDEFVLRGRDGFAYYPNGMGRSKMTLDYFERRLKTRATMRNWKTVQALMDIGMTLHIQPCMEGGKQLDA